MIEPMCWNMMLQYSTHVELTGQLFRKRDHLISDTFFTAMKVLLPFQNGNFWISFPLGFFNWTMTYKWDSDVVHSYLWMEPIDENVLPMHTTPEDYKQSMESFLLSI